MTASRVLIVDDEPAIREAIGLILEAFEVRVAGTVAESKSILDAEEPFDLAIVDKNLPWVESVGVHPAVAVSHTMYRTLTTTDHRKKFTRPLFTITSTPPSV